MRARDADETTERASRCSLMGTRERVIRASALFASMVCAAGAVDAVPLLTGFGGPTGYGLPEHCLPSNDDGSYSGPFAAAGATPVPVDLTPAFPRGFNFFGATYRAMYVNTNGNVTFNGPVGGHRPGAFPIAMVPMIAPWWGDVDTRGGGQPARNNICFHVESGRVVVTWNNVGYFSVHDDLLNDFQLVVTPSNACRVVPEIDIEFRYNRCEWFMGDGSDGALESVPAQAGFDAGDLRDYVELPMSRTRAIVDLCRASNVPGGPSGLWRFRLSDGGLPAACEGGGSGCTVPAASGACARGLIECDGLSARCVQVNAPRDERCNGVDDDCDGEVDEGDGLCATGAVCDRGACVERCRGGGACQTGHACTGTGGCVERACLERVCAEGQRCAGGACVDACEGVACPTGQGCRAGRCVALCDGVLCPPTEVCDRSSGWCVPSCLCVRCAEGEACQSDGRCASGDCAGVACAAGTYCRGGRCRDACEGDRATPLCPRGEVCRLGECVPDLAPALDADAPTDASRPPPDAPLPHDSDVTARDATTGDDRGAAAFVSRDRGCQCDGVGLTSGRARSLVALALGALAALRLRRRPSRRAGGVVVTAATARDTVHTSEAQSPR